MTKSPIILAILISGCRAGPGEFVVSGSAYVESERPEGKAVAKVEVQYRPRISVYADNRPNLPSTGVTLGVPVGAKQGT